MVLSWFFFLCEIFALRRLPFFDVERVRKFLFDLPAVVVKAPKPPAGRVRCLQPTELRALLNACPEGLRQIVALAVSTGMRRGEILGLRYLDVDLANRLIMLPQTKNGSGRIVYLND